MHEASCNDTLYDLYDVPDIVDQELYSPFASVYGYAPDYEPDYSHLPQCDGAAFQTQHYN